MNIFEYANTNGYGTTDNCLVSLVREWNNENYSEKENEYFADKLERMFEEQEEGFEEFIKKPETMEKLFNITWYAVQNYPEDDDWGTGSYDYEEARKMAEKCLKNNGYARIITIREGIDPIAINEVIL